MKLSTLLLSSAALVVAGSAYAADLPAKKGAPAAKAATGCPAFGTGYFAIPGSDTCIKFSGYAQYQASMPSSTGVIAQAASGRLIAEANSNSEIGAIYSNVRLNANASAGTATSDRAWLQAGGFAAGTYGSTTDIAGANTNNFDYQMGYDPSATGVKYSLPVGSSTFTLAAENATNDSGFTSKTPDLIGRLSTSVAGAKFNLVGVSHQNSVGSGYAVLASASMGMGPMGVGAWGGTSQGSIAHTGTQTTLTTDVSSAKMVTGTAYGATVSYAAGPGTFAVDVATSSASVSGATYSSTVWAAQYAFSPAKGITITPEYLNSAVEGTTSNTAYLRIQRDF